MDNVKPVHLASEKAINRKIKVSIIIGTIFILLFLALLSVAIAYLADYLVYMNTDSDGLLWTVAQRSKGLFNLFG
ncbi:hypothetical protein ACT1UH_02600 [Mycoplasma sp. 332]|uniref:hypothetical protein n=1 Tax=unclassified Asterococcus (in: mycoplasmas, genus) TaxID=3407551 RepID=UPI003F657E88